jgi:hypothetical protein
VIGAAGVQALARVLETNRTLEEVVLNGIHCRNTLRVEK